MCENSYFLIPLRDKAKITTAITKYKNATTQILSQKRAHGGVHVTEPLKDV